jgi:hypothetical protein
MKKIFYLSILFILLIKQGNCQKPGIGLHFGGTFASYKSKADDLSFSSKTKLAFTVGVAFDRPMGTKMSFRPGLNYVQKGGNVKETGVEDKLTINYLEIPLNVVYDIKIPEGKFFVGGGPSLSMGLSGKDKWAFDNESGIDKIKFGAHEDLKKFEAGLNFLTGYQSKKGVLIAASYNTALSNSVSPNDGYNSHFYNRYFALRVGYMF